MALKKHPLLTTKNPNAILAQEGEERVADFLKKAGYAVLAQNFRCKQGEVDIIVSRGSTLACVEVKTRKNDYFALSDVITLKKKMRVVYAGKLFAHINGYDQQSYTLRFDVALVYAKDNKFQVDFIENAFTCTQQETY